MSSPQHWGKDDGPVETPECVTRSEFDWTDVAPSTAVIELIAEESGQDPTELDPLYGSVDPEALDRLVSSNGTNPHDHILAVSFSFDGYAVVIQSGGLVELSLDA